MILAFIGVKLILEALHTNTLPFLNDGLPLDVPVIGIEVSLAVIVGVLLITTVASLVKVRYFPPHDAPRRSRRTSRPASRAEDDERSRHVAPDPRRLAPHQGATARAVRWHPRNGDGGEGSRGAGGGTVRGRPRGVPCGDGPWWPWSARSWWGSPRCWRRVRGDAQADPQELRDRIAASAGVGWTGYAEARATLGLPRIAALADVTTLLSGVTRMRGWYAGPDRARTDVLSAVGERDRYVTPRGQAVWDYGAELLTIVARDPEVRLPRSEDLLPPDLARRLLAGTAPSDPATALPARRVAGVDAAGVRVTVADPETTVDALDVWADPATGLPVAVEVRARAASPSR